MGQAGQWRGPRPLRGETSHSPPGRWGPRLPSALGVAAGGGGGGDLTETAGAGAGVLAVGPLNPRPNAPGRWGP